ncbi:MAG: RagB/SusD family nutrient uptake outer membrane protein [Dysgonamonadaceae bacterium]|nr:RagB/SusD family nutrient uptake outer membrane protein [Dysgonamonadaceae bacterium]
MIFRKLFPLLFLALFFASCSKDADPASEEEPVEEQKTPPFIIKATVEKGNDYNDIIDSVSANAILDYDNLRYIEIARCAYKAGAFELQLPDSVDELLLHPFVDYMSEAYRPWSSDNEAKMLIVELFLGLQSELKTGDFSPSNPENQTTMVICYADRDFTIVGTDAQLEADIQFKKGWNSLIGTVTASNKIVIRNTKETDDIKWYFAKYNTSTPNQLPDAEVMTEILYSMKEIFKELLIRANIFDAVMTHDISLSSESPSLAATYRNVGDFTFDASDQKIDDLYSGAYQLIMQTNYLLTEIASFTTVSVAECEAALAEAYYYQAYAYSLLLNYFGGVPIYNYTQVLMDLSLPVFRNTAEEVRNHIADNCTKVIALAPADRRDLRYGALQLMARMNLNFQLYAFDCTSEIVDSYSLPMFEKHLWGADAISEGIAYTAEDGYPEALQKGEKIYPIRYSETLLLHSEAAVETDRPDVAIKFLNHLLAWRGEQLLDDKAAPDEIRKRITDLWSTELRCEGLTFARLKRSETLLEKLKPFGVTEKHKLLPIPSKRIEYNPNLTQNPGW